MATNKRKRNSRGSNNTNNSRKNESEVTDKLPENASENTLETSGTSETPETVELKAEAKAELKTELKTELNVQQPETAQSVPQTEEVIMQNTESDAKNTNNETSEATVPSDTTITMQQGEETKIMAPNTNETKTPEAKKANKTVDATRTPAPVVQKSGSGFATTMATMAFALSVAAAGGIYWNWQQMQIDKNESASIISGLQQQIQTEMQKTQQALQSQMSSTQAAIKSELSQTSATIRSELDNKAASIEGLTKNIESTTNTKIAGAEERFTNAQAELGKANHEIKETQKRQQSLEVSIDGLYSRIGNTSRDWVIAEADYLLKIANHRLQLEQDVTTSIQALTLADQRINSLQDPALTEVRNVIAQELVTLQTLAIPDQAGVSMQLTELQAKIDELPLNARTLPTNSSKTATKADDAMQVDGWEALPGAILSVLEGLVAVNYNDKPIEPLLSPEQVKHLHENLKLKLEQARMVLLRGDKNLYQANMDLAINWTEKFFNTEEVSTKKFIDTLTYLKAKQVVLQVPDISSSLRTLRRVSKRLEINAVTDTKSATTTNLVMN